MQGLSLAQAPEFTHTPPQKVVYWIPPPEFGEVAKTWTPPPEYEWVAAPWSPPKGWKGPTTPWEPPAGWGQPEQWTPPLEIM
ncbi:MAG: hypothetical protein ABIH22_00480 [Candidatus Margulisiibacteriota bacterium]